MMSSRFRACNHQTVTVLIFLCTLVSFFERMGFSIAFTSIAEEHALTETAKGLALSSYYTGFTVSQIPGGYLTKRFGGKNTLALSFLLWSPLSAVLAASTSSGYSVAIVLACRLGIGLAQGIFLPAAHSVLGHWTPQRCRGRHFAFAMSGMFAGAALAMVTVPTVVSRFGAHTTFYIAAGMGAAWLGLWICAGSDAPRAVVEGGKGPIATAQQQEDWERGTLEVSGTTRTTSEAEIVTQPKDDQWAAAGMAQDSEDWAFCHPDSTLWATTNPGLVWDRNSALSSVRWNCIAPTQSYLASDMTDRCRVDSGSNLPRRPCSDPCPFGAAGRGRPAETIEDAFSNTGGARKSGGELCAGMGAAMASRQGSVDDNSAPRVELRLNSVGQGHDERVYHPGSYHGTQAPGEQAATRPPPPTSVPSPGSRPPAAVAAAAAATPEGLGPPKRCKRNKSGRGAAIGARNNRTATGANNWCRDGGNSENAVERFEVLNETTTASSSRTNGAPAKAAVVKEDFKIDVPIRRGEAKHLPFPWRAMSVSSAAWACVAGNVGAGMAINVVMSWLPTYYEEFIMVDLEDINVATLVSPYLTMMAFSILGGVSYGWFTNARGFSRARASKIISGVAFALALCVFPSMGLARSSATATLLSSLALASAALSRGGWSTKHVEIAAPEHAAMLYSVANSISAAASVTGVAVTGKLLDSFGGGGAPGAWTAAMGTIGAVSGACGVVFVVYAQGDEILFPVAAADAAGGVPVGAANKRVVGRRRPDCALDNA